MPHAVSAVFTVLGALCFWGIFATGCWTLLAFVIRRTVVVAYRRAMAPDDDDDTPAAELLDRFRALRPPPAVPPPAKPVPPQAVRRIVSSAEQPAESSEPRT